MPTLPIHKTILQVVVLSEDPLPEDISLADVAFQIDEGDWIGSTSFVNHTLLLTAPEVVHELQEIGNDGSFFNFEDDEPFAEGTDPEA